MGNQSLTLPLACSQSNQNMNLANSHSIEKTSLAISNPHNHKQVSNSMIIQPRKLSESCIRAFKHSNTVKLHASIVEKKCQFVYIQPIKLDTIDPGVNTFQTEDDVEEECNIQEQKQIKNVNTSNLDIKDIQTDKTQRTELSLKQSQIQPLQPQLKQQSESINRILVQWSSFIKIKKKNYLQDYIHIKQIGQGAFGTVSKIKMKYGGMFRAAKIVKISALAKKKAQQQKFISQILIPMKTDHPNLNKLFEVFQWKNQYVLIMQLCQGGDLFQCIKTQKAFTQCKVADIMKQIISGVLYLHKSNIIHRDLKPENMLYDNQSKLLKIIDFGTAIQLPPGKKLTNIIGTPYYIAPEVLAGDYNQKCDIWSCGVILYIMLCGQPPFFGRNQEQIMNNIRNQSLSFSNPLWSKRSKQSRKLVAQMLTKNPNERISAIQVLNSEWITNSSRYNDNESIGIEAVKNLQTFHFQNKLKAVVYTYIASQLYSNKDKEKLLHCFRQIDRDGDGVIGKEELVNVFQKHQKNSQVNQNYIDKILKIVDTNGSGLIDFTEFLVAASNQEQLLQKQRLENAFSYLDTDHSGYITAEEIKPFLDNSEKTSEQIKKIFEQVDVNGDGKISKKEFVSLLLKKS